MTDVTVQETATVAGEDFLSNFFSTTPTDLR